jgi:hypothetical protein
MKYLLSVFFVLPLLAQQNQPAALPLLQQHLELTNAQLFGLLSNAQEYNRIVAERQPRLRQVQNELLDETMKPDLDPQALAARYLEIELICREIKDAAMALRTRNLDLLTAAQKTKLKAIEDALKMMPLIAETQSVNITGAWVSPPAGFNPAGAVPPFSMQFFGVPGPVQGCVGTGVLTPR